MKNLLHQERRVKVKEVKERDVFWGYIYTLYVDADNNYYTEESDASERMAKIGTFHSLDDATKAFDNYMDEYIEEISAYKLMNYLDHMEYDYNDYELDKKNGFLISKTGKNGRKYLQYKDEEQNAIIDIDNGDFIEDKNFIKEQLD